MITSLATHPWDKHQVHVNTISASHHWELPGTLGFPTFFTTIIFSQHHNIFSQHCNIQNIFTTFTTFFTAFSDIFVHNVRWSMFWQQKRAPKHIVGICNWHSRLTHGTQPSGTHMTSPNSTPRLGRCHVNPRAPKIQLHARKAPLLTPEKPVPVEGKLMLHHLVANKSVPNMHSTSSAIATLGTPMVCTFQIPTWQQRFA